MPTFYTPLEIAEYLRVSRRTVYTWLRAGKLPAVRADRSWRVTQRGLDEFLRSNTHVRPPIEVITKVKPPRSDAGTGKPRTASVAPQAVQSSIYDMSGVGEAPKPEPVVSASSGKLQPMAQPVKGKKGRRR